VTALKVFVVDSLDECGVPSAAMSAATSAATSDRGAAAGAAPSGSSAPPPPGRSSGRSSATPPANPPPPPACAATLAVQRQEQMTAYALLADLSAVASVELITAIAAGAGTFRQRFDSGLRRADAVCLPAPGASVLERLAREVLRNGRILLGCRPEALRIAGSRRRMAHALARACIDAVPTYAPGQRLPDAGGAWVVRPDAGAPWLDSHLFPSAAAALAWIGAQQCAAPEPRRRLPAAPRHVLQPFIPGKLGSLSLLCRDGAAQLLACNEQRVAMRDNQFHFLGTTVNGLADGDGAFLRLAQAVAAAIPGLWGHVGIDFVSAERGPVVLDVCARPGSAYAGLHASLGCNPAALMLELLGGPANPVPPRPRPLAVSVDLAVFDG
jgi:predicted ATP-grasp superfamily ATP-dependent carboligase